MHLNFVLDTKGALLFEGRFSLKHSIASANPQDNVYSTCLLICIRLRIMYGELEYYRTAFYVIGISRSTPINVILKHLMKRTQQVNKFYSDYYNNPFNTKLLKNNYSESVS